MSSFQLTVCMVLRMGSAVEALGCRRFWF